MIDGNETLARARQRRIEAEAKLEALVAMQRRLRDLEVDSEARAILANDRSLGDFKTLLFQRRSALTAKRSGLSREHAGRQAAERELREIDAELTRTTASALTQLRTMLLKKRTTAMADERARAQAEMDQARQAEEALAVEVKGQRTNVARFAGRYQEALLVRAEIERSRKQLNDIDDRLDFIALESNAPGFVRIESRARTPDIPTKGGRTKLYVFFLVAAVGVGLVVPIAIDFLDGRIKSPAEVTGLIGFPPLGWIIDRIHPRTAAFAVDQMRRLALAVERELNAYATTCIAVTAAKPGEGTTTLVLDLARMLTDLGVRTIAVEANAFKPDSRFMGGEEVGGFAAALDGTAKIETPIVAGTDVLPDRLPMGEIHGKPHLSIHGELRPALDNVLQELRGMYDLILPAGCAPDSALRRRRVAYRHRWCGLAGHIRRTGDEGGSQTDRQSS
jgi:succinoglycan biosynthesis transport protein ExoP